MRKLFLIWGLLSILSIGCTLDKEYVKRDEATFKSIAPEYSRYVEADPNLTPAQKKDRADLVTSWGKRIEDGK